MHAQMQKFHHYILAKFLYMKKNKKNKKQIDKFWGKKHMNNQLPPTLRIKEP